MLKPHITGDQAAARHSEARRVGRFVAVGCVAAAVHWAVVVAVVSQWGWQPLVANVLGWLLAFTVSFAGHHQLTFRDRQAPVWGSVGRFFVVSAAGFCVNEVTYALLLGWSGQRYDLVLAAVLLAVAVFTFLLSRGWVFLRSEAH
jgi:putative flippase GtrA